MFFKFRLFFGIMPIFENNYLHIHTFICSKYKNAIFNCAKNVFAFRYVFCDQETKKLHRTLEKAINSTAKKH